MTSETYAGIPRTKIAAGTRDELIQWFKDHKLPLPTGTGKKGRVLVKDLKEARKKHRGGTDNPEALNKINAIRSEMGTPPLTPDVIREEAAHQAVRLGDEFKYRPAAFTTLRERHPNEDEAGFRLMEDYFRDNNLMLADIHHIVQVKAKQTIENRGGVKYIYYHLHAVMKDGSSKRFNHEVGPYKYVAYHPEDRGGYSVKVPVNDEHRPEALQAAKVEALETELIFNAAIKSLQKKHQPKTKKAEHSYEPKTVGVWTPSDKKTYAAALKTALKSLEGGADPKKWYVAQDTKLTRLFTNTDMPSREYDRYYNRITDAYLSAKDKWEPPVPKPSKAEVKALVGYILKTIQTPTGLIGPFKVKEVRTSFEPYEDLPGQEAATTEPVAAIDFVGSKRWPGYDATLTLNRDLKTGLYKVTFMDPFTQKHITISMAGKKDGTKTIEDVLTGSLNYIKRKLKTRPK